MAKKKAKVKQFVIVSESERYEITGETGKYWICGDTQFRKSRGLPVCEEKIVEETAEEGADE